MMKKRVYIAWSHHHVLKEWYRYREYGMQLLSFDYHTDFRGAFCGKSGRTYPDERTALYMRKHIPCNDVCGAIKDLENDEHIDFAIRSGIIKRSYVFSHNEYGRRLGVLTVPPLVMNEKQIQMAKFMSRFAPRVLKVADCGNAVISHGVLGVALTEGEIVSFPECRHPLLQAAEVAERAKLVTTDDVLGKVLETFREEGFNQDNYILDFDCDFIRNKDAMTHERFDVLKSIMRGAKAITIAQEPDCVSRCSEGRLTFEDIEAWIVGLIRDCVDDVAVVHEQ